MTNVIIKISTTCKKVVSLSRLFSIKNTCWKTRHVSLPNQLNWLNTACENNQNTAHGRMNFPTKQIAQQSKFIKAPLFKCYYISPHSLFRSFCTDNLLQRKAKYTAFSKIVFRQSRKWRENLHGWLPSVAQSRIFNKIN